MGIPLNVQFPFMWVFLNCDPSELKYKESSEPIPIKGLNILIVVILYFITAVFMFLMPSWNYFII